METQTPYQVAFIATSPAPAPTLTSLLLACQAEANAMLAAAGYPTTTAQVSITTLPNGFGVNCSVSASDPRAAFGGNLSYGMGATPEAALNDFNARLVPAQAA